MWVAVLASLLMVVVGVTPASATPAPARQVSAPPVMSPNTALPHALGARLPTVTTVLPDASPDPDASPSGQRLAAAVPASVDLRKWAVPVGNQGQVNSCVGWVVGYSMMGWWAKRLGQPVSKFSPMYVYSQINGGVDGGANPLDAFAIAADQGVAAWGTYPSSNAAANNWRTWPTSVQKADAAHHRIFRVLTLFSLAGGDAGARGATAIKAVLASGSPVSIAFRVRGGSSGFEYLTALNNVDNDVSSPVVGGHDVMAVGYDGSGLIVQNQWGTGWGDAGYAHLGWNVVQKDVQEADAMVFTRPAIVGHVDHGRLGAAPGTMLFAGWAFDPSHSSDSLTVKVYENSVSAVNLRATWPANRARPDTDRTYGITGVHGFSGSIGAAPGAHKYILVAADGGFTTRIGTAAAKLSAPVGHLDSSGSPTAGKVRLAGWAFDPDVKSASVRIDVFEGAVTAKNFRGSVPADRVRADVDRTYKITGNHGFNAPVKATPGTHTYRLVAVAGGSHVLIGVQQLTVRAPGS